MPFACRRNCPVPGCPGYAEIRGRCKIHASQAEAERNARRRGKLGTTTERGLGADWVRLRALKLATDPFCQINTHCIQGTIATEVDHIVPRSKRPDLRLEWSNLQSSCKACNSAKADREQEPIRF